LNTLDVAIIGAGAAGASAAFHLANSGNRVILLEKNSKKIIKPCGGGMASSVQKLFPFELKPVIDEVINKVEFSWKLSDKVIANLPGSSPFWIVQREELDQFLINQAINSGAEILNSFNVKSIHKGKNIWVATSEEGQQIEAKSIVIADGSNSPWAKQFNLGPRRQRHALTTSVRIQRRGNLENGTTRFEFGLVPYGFSWAFPLKKGINIGVGTFIGQQQSTQKILDKLLPSLGFEPQEGIRTTSKLRIWNGHSQLHSNGIVIIGDAASLCDPFLAEGLRPSLISGYEAAKCIHYWLKGDIPDLSQYTKSMRTKWGESMAWGNRIAQVFYRFPRLGYQLGIKRPTAPARIAQILSGEMGYGDIAQRVIKRLLFK
tara:strand:- start:1365 stop:2486 length:1122 start_codon:yes stop_codon:yes gene_type:complete